jgi:hypothetical protein
MTGIRFGSGAQIRGHHFAFVMGLEELMGLLRCNDSKRLSDHFGISRRRNENVLRILLVLSPSAIFVFVFVLGLGLESFLIFVVFGHPHVRSTLVNEKRAYLGYVREATKGLRA